MGLVESKEHTEFKFQQLKFEFPLMRSVKVAKSLIFIGILITHWTAQFVAEAYAERSASWRILDRVLAVPLVSIAGHWTLEYYWTVTTLNSVLWAVVLTYVIARYALKH